MPSPIAHSVTGFAILVMFRGKHGGGGGRFSHATSLLCIFIAVLPDFDFIPQLLTGEKYHHTFTHSIMFAFLFAVAAKVIRYFSGRRRLGTALLLLAIYSSHLVMDFFTEGGRGIQLFWPFSGQLFISPVSLFPGTHHSKGFFSPAHYSWIMYEMLYSLLLLTGLYIWKKRKHAME